MAPLVILRPAHSAGEIVVARRAHLHERLAARWRAHSLDSELARGVAPEARAALALRAQTLGEPRVRWFLARQVQRVLDEARWPPRPSRARIPPRRDEVLAAAEELDALATRLMSPGFLASRGLASVRLLLSDGRSPLYWHGATEELRAAVSRAREALEPRIEW
ncbi:MAG TPA: hypothetical protein VGH93_04040 [Solirubrobacteraceae bacterium]